MWGVCFGATLHSAQFVHMLIVWNAGLAVDRSRGALLLSGLGISGVCKMLRGFLRCWDGVRRGEVVL